jgi:putative membrane protein
VVSNLPGNGTEREMSSAITIFNGPFSPHDMDSWMWGWGFSLGWLFLVFVVAFWIAVILTIIFLIRWLVISTARKGRGPKIEDSAFEILRMRYAKGEINKEEFEQKKKDLGH